MSALSDPWLSCPPRPRWDDPVLSIALVANGWVLLLGHGLAQIACLCRGAGPSREAVPDFSGWASPTIEFPGPTVQKEGRDNGSFENDGADRTGERRGEGGLHERKNRRGAGVDFKVDKISTLLSRDRKSVV